MPDIHSLSWMRSLKTKGWLCICKPTIIVGESSKLLNIIRILSPQAIFRPGITEEQSEAFPNGNFDVAFLQQLVVVGITEREWNDHEMPPSDYIHNWLKTTREMAEYVASMGITRAFKPAPSAKAATSWMIWKTDAKMAAAAKQLPLGACAASGKLAEKPADFDLETILQAAEKRIVLERLRPHHYNAETNQGLLPQYLRSLAGGGGISLP
ncbi:hypothetical protein P389DRAFT_187769 [Cystobasidium minutum MCA 4210]|uniref:uncharacterized protein n=1 Tax=Cystobasidium minutum MCA 4210 TaxID=1397322 RepID=UPI0034CE2B88|eukprot:jgi/Rhomi1/187769/estExt_fgenesh1_pg.C_2_t10001